MNELQMVMDGLDVANANIQSWTGLGAIFGIPWCVLLAMCGSTLFSTFFSRH